MKREDINIRDPFILPYEGKYYLYGSRGSEVWEDNATGLDVYVSDDLENWSEPKEIFTRTADFWADRHYWAPEVYAYNGAFYMFASFKSADRCRGTMVLKADKPDGKFTVHSEGTITPPDWESLDGTLYISKSGKPYMILLLPAPFRLSTMKPSYDTNKDWTGSKVSGFVRTNAIPFLERLLRKPQPGLCPTISRLRYRNCSRRKFRPSHSTYYCQYWK